MNEIAAVIAKMQGLALTPEQLAEHERLEAERREAEEAARAKARRKAALSRLEDLPIDADIAAKVVDGGIVETDAVKAVHRWIDALAERKGKPTLVLLGGPGTGKTIAAGVAYSRQRDAEYRKMRDVANLYRAGFGEDAERWQRMLTRTLVIVDELTTERDVDLGRAALHELIDERQPRRRATLLIANRTASEIRERYDARTIDRLREGAVVVSLSGKSMRRGAAL